MEEKFVLLSRKKFLDDFFFFFCPFFTEEENSFLFRVKYSVFSFSSSRKRILIGWKKKFVFISRKKF